MNLEEVVRNVKRDYVNITIGKRPSGVPHFGNLHVINTAFLLAEQAQNAGKSAIVHVSLCDMDAATNLMLGNVPLAHLAEDKTNGETYSTYFGDIVRIYLADLKTYFESEHGRSIEYRVSSDSELFQQRRFRDKLIEYLSNYEGSTTKGNGGVFVVHPTSKRMIYSSVEGEVLRAGWGVEVDLSGTDGEYSLRGWVRSGLRDIVQETDVHISGGNNTDFSENRKEVLKRLHYFDSQEMLLATIGNASSSQGRGVSLPTYQSTLGEGYISALVRVSTHLLNRNIHEIEDEEIPPLIATNSTK